MPFLLRVHAGSHPRHLCPVSLELPLDARDRVMLLQQPGGRPRHVQLETTQRGARVTWLVAKLHAGEIQEFRLEPAPKRRHPSPRVRWRQLNEEHWQAILEAQPVGQWRLAPSGPIPGLTALFHPSRAEEPLLEGGHFLPQLVPAPIERVVLTRLDQLLQGPVYGRMTYHCQWLGTQRVKLAEVETSWIVYATPALMRLLDVTLTIRATTGPVQFEATDRNGLLHLHLSKRLPKPTLAYLSEPRLSLADHTAQVGVFEHRDNPGRPCGWLLDEDGWLHAAPFAGLASLQSLLPEPRLSLALGEATTWRYRLAVHAGEESKRALARIQNDLLDPPQVELVATR